MPTPCRHFLLDKEQIMKNHIIQFGQLEELVAELKPNNIVRAVILDISKNVSAQIPNLRQVSVGVHVRTINADGHILACYLPWATIQLFNGRRQDNPNWQKYNEVWEKAEVLKERVMVYLQKVAVEREFTVSNAGVIDMGDTGHYGRLGNLIPIKTAPPFRLCGVWLTLWAESQ
jgi:hypothetical protein